MNDFLNCSFKNAKQITQNITATATAFADCLLLNWKETYPTFPGRAGLLYIPF